MLAAQVADLACLREGTVARRRLAADEGVQVGQRRRAVAVLGDWLVVDVVDCGPSGHDGTRTADTGWLTEGSLALGEVGESDLEEDANAVGVRNCGDFALGISAIGVCGRGEGRGRECRDVDRARNVVRDDRGIA